MAAGRPGPLGMLLLPAYLLATIVIGWLARRAHARRGGRDALTATRSLPLPVVVIAYLAANCGALEVVGMAALSAQYGVRALHFYWVGAVPAIVFLSLRMMPAYVRSGIRTLPEYLQVRFGPRLRRVNAMALAVLLPLLGGISLYALAQVLHAMLDVPYAAGGLITVALALTYVLLGGVRANIYNELLQLAVVLAGVAPIAVRSLHVARGALVDGHLWRGLPLVAPAAPLDVAGVVGGLGFVLAFSYWCTDFVQMQRALTARSERDAQRVPLWAGLGKLLVGFVFVLPGLAAARLFPALGSSQRFDQALPLLMRQMYGPTLLGLGLTALAASLLSGLAANITAGATVFTEDVYRTYLRPNQSARHYTWVSRAALVAAAVASLGASALTFLFHSLLEYVQILFSVFSAPFFAVFALGVLTRRATERGALAGFAAGMVTGLVHAGAVVTGNLRYGSTLTASFYGALLSCVVAALICLLVSGDDVPHRERPGPISAEAGGTKGDLRLVLAAGVLLVLCLALNLWFA